VFSAAAVLILAACSAGSNVAGNGGIPGAGDQKKGAIDAEHDSAVRGGPKAQGSGSSDAADQPVQVIGTYLACDDDGHSDTMASIGCNVLHKADKAKIDLTKASKSFSWNYFVPTNTPGTVLVVPQAPSAKWHVIYKLSADTAENLAKLQAALHVVLDAVPVPGQALANVTHLDSGLKTALAAANPPAAPPVPAGDVFIPPTPVETKAKLITDLVTAAMPQAPAPQPTPASGFPTLAGKHFPTDCLVSGTGHAIKDTFFGDQDGVRTLGRLIYYFDSTACMGSPTRTVKSVPEVVFYYFAGEAPIDGALAVSYDPASTQVSFYVRMDGDTKDTKVSFETGL
jgi:hypothetical protein